METDHAEQLDDLLNQPIKQKSKAEETDASTMSEKDKRSPSPLDNQDNLTAFVMDAKKDTDVTSEGYKLKSTVGSKSIVAPQKVASTDFTTEKQRDKAFHWTKVAMIPTL